MTTRSRKRPAPKPAGAPEPTPPPEVVAPDPLQVERDRLTEELREARDRLAQLEKLTARTAESVAATHLLFAGLKLKLDGAHATDVKAVQGAIDAAWANCTAALDAVRADWRKWMPWLLPVGLGVLGALSVLGFGRSKNNSNITKNWPTAFPPSDTPEAT